MIRDLFKRSSLYFLGLSLSKLLSVFVFILFARALKPSEFGDLVLYATLGQIITTFGDFGLSQWYQKKAHVDERSDLFSKLINARILSLIISLVIASLFFYLTQTFVASIVILFLASMIFDSLTSVIDGYYFDKKQSFIVSLKTILRMCIFLVGYFYLKESFTFYRAVQIYLAGAIATLAIFFPWNMLKALKLEAFKTCWTTLKQSSSYALLTLTSFAYARGDSLVVKYMLNSAALGIYGAAYRFLEGLALLPTAIQHNLFPISAKEDQVSYGQVKKITFIMSVIGVLTGLMLFVSADLVIRFTVGENYLEAIPILKIFSLVVMLFFISSPLNTVILSSQLVNSFLPYGILNTFLNIFINIIFVPILGIIGAAWAMFITELTGLLINVYFARKLYK